MLCVMNKGLCLTTPREVWEGADTYLGRGSRERLDSSFHTPTFEHFSKNMYYEIKNKRKH